MKNVFVLPKTALEILQTLRSSSNPLTVRELSRIIGKSERTIRRYIRLLVSKGLVIRDVVKTNTKKLAYRYILPTKDYLEEKLYRELLSFLQKVYGSN